MTFRLFSLGCKMNAYESEALREKLLSYGYEEAKEGPADLLFVNTCAVTHVAEQKDKKLVRELHRLYPEARIFVMGCSSQIHPEWYKSLEGVAGLTGTSRREDLLACVSGGESYLVEKDTRKFTFEDSLSISSSLHEAKAYLKVQDGCNNFCSYCIVPYSRGVSRSRKHEDILEEAKRLLKSGVKELIVGGIDVGSYEDPQNPDYRLAELLEDLANVSEEDYRVRVSSIEASQITPKYISLFAQYKDKLCPHFHIPLQSGSEKILKLMNRRYSLEDYYQMTLKIKEEIPNVGLSTDVICGFPGEGEEEFEETYSFLKKVSYLRIHAFPYSERDGTPAAKISRGVVPMAIRRERVRKLVSLSKELDLKFRKEHQGEKVRILVEQIDKRGYAHGYSENYLPFVVPSEGKEVGEFLEALIR